MRAEEDKRMASDERLRGLAEGWLMRVNHMSLKELSERLLHGEVESLVAMLLEVRDEAQGRDARLLEEALERGRATLHKAIQDRADMQAKLAAEVERLTKERDDARQLADDIDTLIWSCSKGIHDSTQWEREYGAEWQAVWQRRNW